MDKKNIILIVIAILVVALVAVAAYIYVSDNTPIDITDNTTENKTVIDVDKAENLTNDTNTTVVGDNSTRADEPAANNTTYKVYNPQSDSYVPVIGEKFDDEVNRWYTYDEDGVRYYNTRIN